MDTRRANVDDAWAIASVHVQSWQAAYRGLLPQDFLDTLSVAEREIRWRGLLARAETATLVAEEQGQIIGFTDFGPGRDDDSQPWQREMYALYVLPEHWRRGVGQALWAVFAADCRTAGSLEMLVWVLAGNVRARRFYESRGALSDGRSKTITLGGKAIEETRYRCRTPINPRHTL